MEDIKNKSKMISFKTPSHLYFEKGKGWFVGLFAVLLIFIGLLIYIKQYLGAVVLVAAGVVFAIYSKLPPKEITCIISSEGVNLEERFYPHSSLKAFWIAEIFENPILYLESGHRFKPSITIPLKNQPTDPIRKILREYLPEKSGRGEDIRDKLIRIFRF